MKTSIAEALQRLPGPATTQYPAGAPSIATLTHGSMRLLLFKPSINPDGRDHQVPHTQDELYLIHSGNARFNVNGESFTAAPGDAFFVPAAAEHRFDDISPDFATWVVFYGPLGGEEK